MTDSADPEDQRSLHADGITRMHEMLGPLDVVPRLFSGWGEVVAMPGSFMRRADSDVVSTEERVAAFVDVRLLEDRHIRVGAYMPVRPGRAVGYFVAQDIVQCCFAADKGMSVQTEGGLVSVAGGMEHSIFHAERLRGVWPGNGVVAVCRMVLTNADYLTRDDALKRHFDPDGPDHTAFSVADFTLRFKQNDDDATGAICEITKEGGLGWHPHSDEFINLARRLRSALSLAIGTVVSVPWIYGYDQDGHEILSLRLATHPRPMGRFVQQKMWCGDIPGVVRAVFVDAPVTGVTSDDLEHPISLLGEAGTTATSIECRALICSSVLDALSLQVAFSENAAEIMPRKRFAKHFASPIRDLIRSLARGLEVPEEDAERLTKGVAGLYRASFRDRLELARDRLRLPFNDDEIDVIVRSRNAVVHEVEFREQRPHGAVGYFEAVGERRAMGFLDLQVVIWAAHCTLLRLSGYEGDLPDWKPLPMYSGASLGY